MHHEGRSWRELVNIVNHLPGHSHYVTARRNDPDLAAWVASQPESKKKWTPPPEAWGLEQELLAAVVDRLGELLAVTASGITRRSVTPPEHFPRPVTEIDMARRRLEAAVEDELGDLIAEAQDRWRRQHTQEQAEGG